MLRRVADWVGMEKTPNNQLERSRKRSDRAIKVIGEIFDWLWFWR